ncbi:hypothetical protein BN988_01824 [Oceanobacillus picturae]|uniref:Uncharacterized protein n=1 Tax=Oceanobacillus picturae TaxID=171693 RepID=W9AC55_9BACI|nr:hypothetical protein [Oceanobacillus picturae]CDO03314.1 hypothetical protein BN988_01824 [Oceanobacillus picturae]
MGDISNRDIMQAITELGQQVSGLANRMEKIETRVSDLEIEVKRAGNELKQDIRKLDAKFSVLSDSVVETKADMKLLKQNQH